MEINEFKQKWNGKRIQLIDAVEKSVLVNVNREFTERMEWIREMAGKLGWSAVPVVIPTLGTIVVIGDTVTLEASGALLPCSAIDVKLESFAELNADYSDAVQNLENMVKQSRYVMGAIRSLGFDVREDTLIERCSPITMADYHIVRADSNTSVVSFFSTDEAYRDVRWVAIAGAGWYKVTFARNNENSRAKCLITTL